MNKQIIQQIEKQLCCSITHQEMVGGGCIAQTSLIETNNGESFFLKQGFKSSMFEKETNGLNELCKANVIRTPKIIATDEQYLLLENIESGSKCIDFFEKFGKAFAQLHKHLSPHYGFYEDNYIGSSQQINSFKDSWQDFYFTNRLLYQYKLAESNGYSDSDFQKAFLNIEKQFPKIIEGSEERPCLLHGDLWAGNYMVDKNGEPVLIDPAVYYGHREADLAMTKLFGGFAPDFYNSYEDEYPLIEGYEYRENIYLLYHILNHLNIFGHSYKKQALQLMNSY